MLGDPKMAEDSSIALLHSSPQSACPAASLNNWEGGCMCTNTYKFFKEKITSRVYSGRGDESAPDETNEFLCLDLGPTSKISRYAYASIPKYFWFQALQIGDAQPVPSIGKRRVQLYVSQLLRALRQDYFELALVFLICKCNYFWIPGKSCYVDTTILLLGSPISLPNWWTFNHLSSLLLRIMCSNLKANGENIAIKTQLHSAWKVTQTFKWSLIIFEGR